MKHQKKAVREAIDYAISRGWRFKRSSGQATPWGIQFCPAGNREGHQFTVASTPRNEQDHAQDIRRAVDRCHH